MTPVQGKQEVPENECLWEQSSTSNDGDLVNTEPISALKEGNLDVSYSASQTFQKSCASVALSGSQLNKVHLYRFLLSFSISLFPWLHPGVHLYSHPGIGLDWDYVSGDSALAELSVLLHVISHLIPHHAVSNKTGISHWPL